MHMPADKRMIHQGIMLFRPLLALTNGVTAVGGYSLFPAPLNAAELLAVFFGVTFLAMGGSALNQILECDIDALMDRTKMRPLPRKRISTLAAVFSGIITILVGLVLLASGKTLLPPFFGVASLIWYLAIYTPLKRKTSLALPIGALCGALSPLVGWSMAGGAPTDYRVITLAGLLFLWQILHFWLLQQRHAEEYLLAEIPLFGAHRTIAGISFFWLWTVAFCAGVMLLPAFRLIERPGSLWCVLFPVPIIIGLLFQSGHRLFPYFNCFPLLVTLLLLIQMFQR
jgi:protoheme IX farnesyltransferase